MKVDLDESKENVNKRLQFIENELTKIDNQIADKQGLQTTLGEEVGYTPYRTLTHCLLTFLLDCTNSKTNATSCCSCCT